MPILVECDGCSKKYRLPDDKAGGTFRCKECGTKVEIPDDDLSNVRLPERKKNPAKRKKQSGAPIGFILGIGGIGVFAIAAVIAAFVLIGRNRNPAPPPVDAGNPPIDMAHNVPPAGLPPGLPQPGMPFGQMPVQPAPAQPTPVQPARNPVIQRDPDWAVEVDGPATTVDWPAKPSSKLDFKGGKRDTTYVPSTPSPIIVTQQAGGDMEVTNLATGKTIGGFSKRNVPSLHSFVLGAVHPDGTLVAAVDGLKGVEIWDSKRQEKIQELGKSSGRFEGIRWVDFGRERQILILCVQHLDSKLFVVDIDSTKILHEYAFEGNLHGKDDICVSPGRRYVALSPGFTKPGLVYDTVKGRVAGRLPALEHIGVIFGFQFSPDGATLAVVGYDKLGHSIWVFDMATGERKETVAIPDGAVQNTGTANRRWFQWLSDGSGWLLGDYRIIDRESGATLWRVAPDVMKAQQSAYVPTWIVTPHGLWCIDSKVFFQPAIITVVPEPWAHGRELLSRLDDESNLVRPGTPVCVKAEIGDVRFSDKASVQAEMVKVFQEKLKSQKLVMDDGSPLVLRVKYSEVAGKTLVEVEGAFQRKVEGGRSVQATNSLLETSWTDESGELVLWKQAKVMETTMAYMSSDTTDASMRASSFNELTNTIPWLSMPRYLTADPSEQLPVMYTTLPFIQ